MSTVQDSRLGDVRNEEARRFAGPADPDDRWVQGGSDGERQRVGGSL